MFPGDKAKIISILSSTVNLRHQMLQANCSIKKNFAIFLAFPELVSRAQIIFYFKWCRWNGVILFYFPIILRFLKTLIFSVHCNIFTENWTLFEEKIMHLPTVVSNTIKDIPNEYKPACVLLENMRNYSDKSYEKAVKCLFEVVDVSTWLVCHCHIDIIY